MTHRFWRLAIGILLVAQWPAAAGAQLDETCMVSALNRTAPVDADGVWVLREDESLEGLVASDGLVMLKVRSLTSERFVELPLAAGLEVLELVNGDPR